MNFIKPLGITEIIIISAFFIFYLLYLIRLNSINKKIKVYKRKVLFKLLLRSIYFFLLIISLLGPSFGDNKQEVNIIGKDIMILVDLSESMNANDVKPTRLEKIKFEMKKIIDEFSSDRIGIIMFSSEAFVQCPMTYDKNALNLFTETLNTGLVPNSGTDFGPALELSLSKLNDENSQTNDINSKIILLISDGEDSGEETESALNKINESNIKGINEIVHNYQFSSKENSDFVNIFKTLNTNNREEVLKQFTKIQIFTKKKYLKLLKIVLNTNQALIYFPL